MKRSISLGALALVVLAVTASAQSRMDRCGALNNRPVPVWSEFTTGLSIQDMIDDMVWAGPTWDCRRRQSGHSVFRPGFDRTVVFTFADGRYFSTNNVFGVYEVNDPTNKVVVFEGDGLSPGDQVVMTFLPNGDVLRNGQLVGQSFSSCFGVYADIYDASPLAGGNPAGFDWTFHSEDALNLDGSAQILVYRGYNTTMMRIPGANHIDPWLFADDEVLLALEDLPLIPQGPDPIIGADRDYNEAAIFLQGVQVLRRQPGVVGL